MRIVLYFFLFLLPLSLFGQPRHYLSICAIFRNEARFLKEWIEYHRMIGVEHFYLYNHLSDDDYADVLAPYVQANIIDLTDWPYPVNGHSHWIQTQSAAYNNCLQRFGRQTFWLAVIDTDEFIVLRKKRNLQKFLQRYENYQGLAINWQLYGTSSVYEIPLQETMLENLVYKAPTNFDHNRHIKSIIQPNKVINFDNPHYCYYKDGFFSVTERKEKCKGAQTLSVNIEKICLNHYTYRDEKFFYAEKQRRHQQKHSERASLYMMDPSFNEVYDPILLPYVPALKARLQGY